MFKPPRYLSPEEHDPISGVSMGDRGPLIYTPLTKICEHWHTFQFSPCAALELDYYRCASRVGEKQVNKYCRQMFEDIRECIFREKTIKRYYAMQEERKRQGRPYLETPPKDIFYYTVGIGAEHPLWPNYREFEDS